MVTIKRTSGTYLILRSPLQNSEGNTEGASRHIDTHAAKPQKTLNYKYVGQQKQ